MVRAILVVVGIVGLLAALNRIGTPPVTGPDAIEFWTYGTGGADNPGAVFWHTAAEEFEQTHPGATVRVVADIAHGPYLSVLTTRFIGGNPPDVMVVDDTMIGQLAVEGLLLPLDDYAREDPREILAAYPESMRQDGVVNGVRYSVPLNGGTGLLYYRTDIFADAGLEPPATWGELLSVCAALRDRAGLAHPLAMDPTAAFHLMPWLWQNGGRIVSSDWRTVTVDSPEVVGALTFVRDLVHRHGYVNPATTRGANARDFWSAGDAAMLVDGSWNLGRMDPLYPQWEGVWDVAPMPAGRERVNFFGGQHLVISAGTHNPDLAWAFVAHAASAGSQRLLLEIAGRPPTNERVYDMPGLLEDYPKLDVMSAIMPHTRNNCLAPYYHNVWYQLFGSTVIDMVMQDPEADIALAVRAAAEDMQGVVDEYWATHEYFVQGGGAR